MHLRSWCSRRTTNTSMMTMMMITLDIIPTSLLKSCSEEFAVIIARLANMSFSEGRFPSTFKSQKFYHFWRRVVHIDLIHLTIGQYPTCPQFHKYLKDWRWLNYDVTCFSKTTSAHYSQVFVQVIQLRRCYLNYLTTCTQLVTRSVSLLSSA